MRDFAQDKEAWIACANDGVHFEAKLAHVHEYLFALLNILFGFLLMYLAVPEKKNKIISWALLIGILIPLGVMAEFLFGVPPYLVLVGIVSMIFGTLYFGTVVLGMKEIGNKT